MDSETTETRQRVDDESDEDTSEAQAQVIASLRAQVTDLFSQVTQLNSKLVASYDRVSDLEDQVHDASSSLRNASLTISSLELERSHHLAALNTGLLVEKAHVTAELTRLMERATEEAAQRGQAESARHDIEKDLDDLSATLFDQANTMVAEARLGQARSERKVQDAEQALKFAEDAVQDMQIQMQSLQAAKETAERDAKDAKLTTRKGKWVEHDDATIGEVPRIRFMTMHTPYAEFIAFMVHLRGLRVSQPTPPVMSTLLGQPFVARLLAEDSEPTVRLDLAPSLNWLSRRSVLNAIHAGMLIVEPWSFSSLVQELHQHPQSVSSSSLSCALCGAFIARLPTMSPVARSYSTNGSSWFRYPLARGTPQNSNPGTPPPMECEHPGQVYIFRLAPADTSAPPPSLAPIHTSSVSMSAAGASSRPPLNTVSSSRVLQTQTQNSPYPLCTSNYCLTRLRSTCSLWAFVRVGIVERIWEEDVAQPTKHHVNGDTRESPSPQIGANTTGQLTNGVAPSSASEKPPVPPRRRRLWEMASALGERAVSWGKEGSENNKEKDKDKDKDKEKESDGAPRRLPTPPPSHPSAPHPHAESPTSRVGTVGPPPLPRRNVVRSKTTTDAGVSPSDTQSSAAGPETKESDVKVNGHADADKADSDASDSSPASQNGATGSESKESDVNTNDHADPGKADPNTSDSSRTSVEETTFTAPPSPPSSATPIPHATSTEPSVPLTEDPVPPSSPRTIPLPISRVTSPVPRPRSRVSSPASPPPSSRPTSPAMSRSHTGSPAPAAIVRTMSPTPGSGYAPATPVSHLRGKSSMSLVSSLSRSGSPVPGHPPSPGAPPVPRRAAARRVVPPPPPPASTSVPAPVGAKVDEEESVSPPVATATNATPDTHVSKPDATQAVGEIKGDDAKGDDEGAEAAKDSGPSVPPAAVASEYGPTMTTTETVSGTAGDVTSGDKEDVQGAANGTSAIAVPPLDPFAPEGRARTSMDTAGTKQSSSTEGEGFASDATWEERTWKELVRLKEDMFWARIGGIRVPREP